MAWQGTALTASAWGTANRALYVPVRVPRACVVKELGFAAETTGTGNVDVGLYDAAGTRLVSTGSTAKIVTQAIQAIDVTDTPIQRGLYYLGLNNDTTTDTFASSALAAPIGAALGVLAEALGSVTLPATAAWAIDNTVAFIPVVTALLVTEVS